ncbi:O-methyltransferase [Terrilactibacillus sp. S3-3]|nr:O-methyltransferase [Terrilactibacillus sp. S3-3]
MKPQRILEIGTAVGYSAIKMCCSKSPYTDIVTIERDEKMFHEASKNIKRLGLEKHIRLIFGDAGENLPEVEEEGPYDLIFIDAAKAQYRKFFNRYAPMLSKGGMVVSDNVLFHGLVVDPEHETAKRLRRLAEKVNDYNHWLSEHPAFDTVFLTVGDGLSISTKKC